MKVLFMGTPDFAVPSLEALVSAGHEVAAVYTQPDKPKGRGQEMAIPPVKESAMRLGLEVRQPAKIRTPEALDELRGRNAEAFVVVGYGKILPQTIIDIPRRGIINVHASLLPKYRGAAPVQWAIACGETRTGVTTMKIDAGLDTGDMLLRRETEIGPEETAVELGARLARMGADLLIETLAGLETGSIETVPQNHAEATLAPVLKKEDGRIDWSRPAAEIANRTRGFQPWPGCYTQFRGRGLNVWRARVTDDSIAAGTLEPRGKKLYAGCGEGSLELIELQPEGKKRISAQEFLNGYRVTAGERLE